MRIEESSLSLKRNLTKKIALGFLATLSLNSFASINISNSYWTGDLGMNSVSYQENVFLNSTDSTFKKLPSSGSAGIIVGQLGYVKPIKQRQAISFRGLVPLMDPNNRMFTVGSGYSFFFGDSLISDIKVEIGGGTVTVEPGFRYYVGAQADLSYLFYTSETAKRTDFLFQAGGHAGALYRWKKGIDLKAHFEYAKGFGSVVSTTEMRILLGVSHHLF